MNVPLRCARSVFQSNHNIYLSAAPCGKICKSSNSPIPMTLPQTNAHFFLLLLLFFNSSYKKFLFRSTSLPSSSSSKSRVDSLLLLLLLHLHLAVHPSSATFPSSTNQPKHPTIIISIITFSYFSVFSCRATSKRLNWKQRSKNSFSTKHIIVIIKVMHSRGHLS